MENTVKQNNLATLEFFSGFYHSWHDDAFDQEIEQIIEENNCTYDDLDFTCDWKYYAERYVSAVNSIINMNMKFESLQSPKEYNFTTDRIFVELNKADLDKLSALLKPNNPLLIAVKEKIKAKFTSRDGFCSFYSNNIGDWLDKPFSTYDHNELGTLLEVYAESIEPEIDIRAYEDCISNGAVNVEFTIKKATNIK